MEENIEAITAALTPPNSYFATPGDIKRRKERLDKIKVRFFRFE